MSKKLFFMPQVYIDNTIIEYLMVAILVELVSLQPLAGAFMHHIGCQHLARLKINTNFKIISSYLKIKYLYHATYINVGSKTNLLALHQRPSRRFFVYKG